MPSPSVSHPEVQAELDRLTESRVNAAKRLEEARAVYLQTKGEAAWQKVESAESLVRRLDLELGPARARAEEARAAEVSAERARKEAELSAALHRISPAGIAEQLAPDIKKLVPIFRALAKAIPGVDAMGERNAQDRQLADRLARELGVALDSADCLNVDKLLVGPCVRYHLALALFEVCQAEGLDPSLNRWLLAHPAAEPGPFSLPFYLG